MVASSVIETNNEIWINLNCLQKPMKQFFVHFSISTVYSAFLSTLHVSDPLKAIYKKHFAIPSCFRFVFPSWKSFQLMLLSLDFISIAQIW